MKTAAFYSYKGGVGRSLFVANLAIFLAHFAGKKVLVMDMDLEAPGMPYKFRAAFEGSGVEVPPIEAGIVDTLHGYLYDEERPATLPIVDLWKSAVSGGSVHLYAAGNAPTLAYCKKLDEIDFHALAHDKDRGGVQLFFELHERIREEFCPDIVLIDSRTGMSSIAGAAAQVLAQRAFCLMLDEDEHFEGIRLVMRGIAKCERVDEEGFVQVIPVLSRAHVKRGSNEERALREHVKKRLEEGGVSISSADDILVLHNDDDVYRSGRVLLKDLIRGGQEHPSRLVADYYEVGLEGGFLGPKEKLRAIARLVAA